MTGKGDSFGGSSAHQDNPFNAGDWYERHMRIYIKVATNSRLARSMPDDIDGNAGTIIDGTQTIEEVGEVLFERFLAVASGEKTVSEDLGVGQEEFVPWHVGAVT